ncbi:MAG TPA: TIGR00341 family protein [Phycisphaeraceae bacterium]|nr:TIGR00341 family protein [Phycisphaeraceae bacterium]
MALRLIEAVLPLTAEERLDELFKDLETLAVWHQPVSEESLLVRVLLDADASQTLLDDLSSRFSFADSFRELILPVEATIPAPPEPEKKKPEPEEKPAKKEKRFGRVSREELLNDIAEGTVISRNYLLTVFLSGLVAAVGLVQDSVAIIIGAMVIAPLLLPNMALALATTMGDRRLAGKAVKTNAAGFAGALLFAVVLGLFINIDPTAREIASRTTISFGDLVVALAAGSAGALAFTSGVSASLVGVMVAVALMPPLVSAGLLVGSGHYEASLGAFILVAANVICVNLAAVLTFMFKGIGPRTWWEADRARRAVRFAVGMWTVLLLVLALIIAFRIIE